MTTLHTKHEIIFLAKRLIQLLKTCEDQDWVDEIISCIDDGEIYPCLDIDYEDELEEDYIPQDYRW